MKSWQNTQVLISHKMQVFTQRYFSRKFHVNIFFFSLHTYKKEMWHGCITYNTVTNQVDITHCGQRADAGGHMLRQRLSVCSGQCDLRLQRCGGGELECGCFQGLWYHCVVFPLVDFMVSCWTSFHFCRAVSFSAPSNVSSVCPCWESVRTSHWY